MRILGRRVLRTRGKPFLTHSRKRCSNWRLRLKPADTTSRLKWTKISLFCRRKSISMLQISRESKDWCRDLLFPKVRKPMSYVDSRKSPERRNHFLASLRKLYPALRRTRIPWHLLPKDQWSRPLFLAKEVHQEAVERAHNLALSLIYYCLVRVLPRNAGCQWLRAWVIPSLLQVLALWIKFTHSNTFLRFVPWLSLRFPLPMQMVPEDLTHNSPSKKNRKPWVRRKARNHSHRLERVMLWRYNSSWIRESLQLNSYPVFVLSTMRILTSCVTKKWSDTTYEKSSFVLVRSYPREDNGT